jgi:superfamily II DNA or RNA helicase
MSMHFEDLFVRLDFDDLATLLGPSSIKLIRALDEDAATPVGLNALASTMFPPSLMLRDREKRNLLLQGLPRDEAIHLARALGVDEVDPYQGLTRLTIRPGSPLEDALFAYFGLQPPAPQLEDASPSRSQAQPAYPLFDHQRQAVADCIHELQGAHHRAMLHMPTGAGKTRTAMNVIAERLRAHEPSLVVWLAYSEELCEQAASEFEDAWSRLGNRTVDVYRWWGNRTIDLENARDGFVVLSLPKAFQRGKRNHQFLPILSDRCSLVVFDEAHQATAPTFRFVLERLVDRHPDTPLLGLTATPGRTWNDPDVDAELAGLFARRKVTLKVPGYDNPVDFLIDAGYLARPTFERLEHAGAKLTEDELKALHESLDIPEGILKRLAADEQRNLVIMDRIEKLSHRHQRIIVFAATVEHAHLLATITRARGIDAAAITGATDPAERERLIRKFKNQDPEPSVMFNYGVLTTGFDAPRTSAALIARPTQSLVLYSQMVGRALRGPKANGNANADIVTVVDTNLPGFGQPQDAFTNWEDIWDD